MSGNVTKINGTRKAKKPTRNELENEYLSGLTAMQNQMQMVQMMFQQIMQNQQRMDADITNTINILNDLQYRTLATLEVLNVDKVELEKAADKLKLVDFTTASDAEDVKLKLLTVTDEVKLADWVIFKSTTPDEEDDRGIFRSKVKLGTSGRKEVEDQMLGLKVGDTFDTDLDGTKHVIELLSIRRESPPEPEVETTDGQEDGQEEGQ